jgi:hypothetical protein
MYREGDKQVGGGLYREKRRTQQGLTRADGREDIRESEKKEGRTDGRKGDERRTFL